MNLFSSLKIIGRNPELDIRARFPDVPWESYPDPPSARGPEYCRDFVRQWSDSCTQDSFDTAAELLALQVEFLRTHPWLSENVGEISDGASNYLSTSPIEVRGGSTSQARFLKPGKYSH